MNLRRLEAQYLSTSQDVRLVNSAETSSTLLCKQLLLVELHQEELVVLVTQIVTRDSQPLMLRFLQRLRITAY